MRNLQGRLDLCSINTATLGHREPISLTIERIARAGFGGIAPWRREIESADIAQVARQIKTSGLAVTGYCRSTALPAATPAEFNANVDANRAALRDAATLNAQCFVMVTGGLAAQSRDLPGARSQVTEGIAMLLETARDCGVPLAIEPLHPMYAADRAVVNTLEQALAICRAVDAANTGYVGVAIDAYHCWWDPALAHAIGTAGREKRILAYHTCDWLRDTRDMLLDRGMMGDGVIDLPALRQSVETAGYDGLIEVEIFSAQNWWQRDPDHVLATCAERLQTLC
ncbi:sugar phosphate isomerase/epimerase [Paraburkholderia sp. JPY432]|uniref:sugar phosphate isomerase/epimerase family protein n=1 Tax=Paraburkholderia youngii TaxID=2782701 RepID=UPI001595555D|nr:sugar phosphate isomerase/epimerase family protein [Paraburkholderia youngii]NVH74090.1 sugar phosphate isomerase/epimerase [Paraburkholderia youngii]